MAQPRTDGPTIPSTERRVKRYTNKSFTRPTVDVSSAWALKYQRRLP